MSTARERSIHERESWERYFFVLRMLLWILQNAKFNRTTEEVNRKHEAVRVELHRWFDGRWA